jgi:hypothetical protein
MWPLAPAEITPGDPEHQLRHCYQLCGPPDVVGPPVWLKRSVVILMLTSGPTRSSRSRIAADRSARPRLARPAKIISGCCVGLTSSTWSVAGQSRTADTCPVGSSETHCAGERIVRVPPKLMAHIRDSARTYGKSDPIDALAVARAAQREPDLPVARLDGPDRELRLVDHRQSLSG